MSSLSFPYILTLCFSDSYFFNFICWFTSIQTFFSLPGPSGLMEESSFFTAVVTKTFKLNCLVIIYNDGYEALFNATDFVVDYVSISLQPPHWQTSVVHTLLSRDQHNLFIFDTQTQQCGWPHVNVNNIIFYSLNNWL